MANFNNVIHPGHLPTRLPVTLFLVVILYLHVFDISGWVLGAAVTLMAVLGLGSIVARVRETDFVIRPDGRLEPKK